ncbi:MAG: hypothetical protein WHT08_11105 [Bryobacteraceae bacterium]
MNAAYLLDVGGLVAIFWTRHSAHEADRKWFVAHGKQGSATCSLTEAGFVRVISNPAVPHGYVRPEDAMRLLEDNSGDRHHEFWPLDLTLADA